MKGPLKIGLNIVSVPPEKLVEVCQLAEALGFESVWSGEHVAIPARPDWFEGAEEQKHLAGGNVSSKMPFAAHTPYLDPMVALAAVAAVTQRIRLGIGIYMLGLREPVLVGRTIASLDRISGGRLDLGVGLGWVSYEYAFTNKDWASRGRRTDEIIRCLRVLFEEQSPSFSGEFFNFEPIGFEPKPVQTPVPIHIGGDGMRSVRRAAELGDGWIGSPQLFAPIREALKAGGREHEPFEFTTLAGAATAEQLRDFAGLGADRVVVQPWNSRPEPEPVAVLERYARTIGKTVNTAPPSD